MQITSFTRSNALATAELFLNGMPSLALVPPSTKRGSYRYFLSKLLAGTWSGSIFNAAGNSKLPFYAFSTLPMLTCPGAGACSKFCYSFSAWRFPSAFVRQIANSMLLQTEEGRAKIASAFLALPQGVTVRLYVDGDFNSIETLAFWMQLISQRPDLKVYGYSKSWELFLCLSLRPGFTWPANYMLNLSSGSKYGAAMRERMQALPITRGEFIATRIDALHIRARSYQGKHKAGFQDYAREVRSNFAGPVFVCPGRCGSCLPGGRHACGDSKFIGVKIAIGTH